MSFRIVLYIYEAKGLAKNDLIFIFRQALSGKPTIKAITGILPTAGLRILPDSF
jgi:hypothetical protein